MAISYALSSFIGYGKNEINLFTRYIQYFAKGMYGGNTRLIDCLIDFVFHLRFSGYQVAESSNSHLATQPCIAQLQWNDCTVIINLLVERTLSSGQAAHADTWWHVDKPPLGPALSCPISEWPIDFLLVWMIQNFVPYFVVHYYNDWQEEWEFH